jgi:putative oxidoreductase
LKNFSSRAKRWEELKNFQLPCPAFALAATIGVQLCGGLMVLSGFHTRPGALLLFAFTGAATLVGHRFWAFANLNSACHSRRR